MHENATSTLAIYVSELLELLKQRRWTIIHNQYFLFLEMGHYDEIQVRNKVQLNGKRAKLEESQGVRRREARKWEARRGEELGGLKGR